MTLLVNIDVDDLAVATRFYTGGLALTVGRRLGPDAVELLGAGSPIYLLVKPSGGTPFPGATSGRSYARHWTPVHLDFVVDDLEAALQRALAAGATSEGPIRDAAWGRIVQLADPFGNGLCLLQFKGRGYDEVATD